MRLQELEKLLLEGDLPVVLLLALDVLLRPLHLGNTDAERSVSLLPCEILVFWKGIVDPLRRTALGQLNRLRYGESSGQGNGHVDMVSDPTNGERRHSMSPGDTTQVWEEATSQLVG